jgi:chorismate lyase/3-hydroxybenzoate synthase
VNARLSAVAPADFSVQYQTGAPDEVLDPLLATAGDAERGDATDVLAIFEFGAKPLVSRDPRHVPVALQPLGDQTGRPSCLEVWRTVGAVTPGQEGMVRFARGRDLTMGHIAFPIDEAGGVREAAREAYGALGEFLARAPHHWPLKIWNHIPGINEGEGDRERYRQFCVGRAEALAAGYGEQPPMPAATAIGVAREERTLQVYFLAGALPGLNVENPRQVHAWQYPRRYGPRSPLFSRGTLVELGRHRRMLISGTASVIGHETQHRDNVVRQAVESWRNVQSLVREAHRLLGRAEPKQFAPELLKVYLRDPGDLATVRSTLSELLATPVPVLYLAGDICRRDLLTEIDGIAAL